jgi:hypothetical protein
MACDANFIRKTGTTAVIEGKHQLPALEPASGAWEMLVENRIEVYARSAILHAESSGQSRQAWEPGQANGPETCQESW